MKRPNPLKNKISEGSLTLFLVQFQIRWDTVAWFGYICHRWVSPVFGGCWYIISWWQRCSPSQTIDQRWSMGCDRSDEIYALITIAAKRSNQCCEGANWFDRFIWISITRGWWHSSSYVAGRQAIDVYMSLYTNIYTFVYKDRQAIDVYMSLYTSIYSSHFAHVSCYQETHICIQCTCNCVYYFVPMVSQDVAT